MERRSFFLLIAGLIAAALPGCASDLAQGYRSTPAYPAYAGAGCANVAVTQAVNEAAETYLERRTGLDIKGFGPSRPDMVSGLAIALVSALAERRPAGAEDICGGIAAAQAAASRRSNF